ncbi:MAG: ABC transporter substrate-binding protein, partial [Bacilli bacterium]
MKVNNRFLLMSVLIFACFLLVACTSQASDSETGKKKDSLVLAIGSEPTDGFDPTTGWGRYGSPLFQSTLLTLDRNFNVQPDLAVDYSVSEDGLEWTVKIRDDVKFSDGEPLTIEDVIFTFETAKNSQSVVDLQNLKKIEKLDAQTVKFVLERPQSTFLYTLTMLGIVPKHAYSENYRENPIGSGPYKLVQWDKGQQLIVEENPYYYGKKSPFKKLTFLFLSQDAAFLAAKAGQVDIVSVPP